ncbi:MAG: ABC-F family ATP-binding cassette domain-containing protein [Proteobacteria bacterium]|nr:ABC-F family ATP-binding cassette domain-containing protein [Pseudomonadota bacterium]
MIILQNICKSFGQRKLFDNIAFNFPKQAKIALVGNNGEGKTTLLNILCGFEREYEGEVIKPKNLRLGYLPQVPNPNPKESILLEALDGAIEINNLIKKRDLALEQMSTDYSQEVFDTYEHCEMMLTSLDGYRIEEDLREILFGLGFVEEQLDQPVQTLSGGWRMRLEFAKMLLDRPNFLVLDEPTNHLDLPSIEWFEGYLKRFNGSILFVSHDKSLLNLLADHVLHLRNGKMSYYVGNFDKFLDAFTLAQEQNAHMSKQVQLQSEHIQKFVNRFRASPSKAKLVQSRLRVLAKLRALEESIEFEDLGGSMQLQLGNAQQPGKNVLKVASLVIGYDKPLVKSPLSFIVGRGERVAILGANGLGKSTLLKTMLGMQTPLSGEVVFGHNVIPGYFAQDSFEGLDYGLTVMENVVRAAVNMRDSDVRMLLGTLGFSGNSVFKQAAVLSGGEKSRVALACVLVTKPNLLLLDEPTNHLDIYACENLADALCEYTGTVIFVSHNRDFIARVATQKLILQRHGKIDLQDNDV